MADRKRVLLVNAQPLRRGGTQAVIMSIVRNLSDEFCFDILLFSDEPGYYDEEFTSYGGKIIRFSGAPRFCQRAELYYRGLYQAPKVRNVVQQHDPYVAIHSMAVYEAGVLLKIAYQCGIPNRIAHTHVISNVPKTKMIMRCYAHFALKAIRKYATALIGCTEEACTTMFGDADCCVIRNAYRSEVFDPDKFAENKEQDAPVLMQVASYSANKNQSFTVEVFRQIAERYPNAKLRFVGYELEDGYLAKVKEQIAAYGLSDDVTFYSSDANVPQLMSTSSYFLLPSVREGFGIVLVEAQAMGLRCVVSDTVPKITDCGGCAFLPLSQPEAWAKHILSDFEQTCGARTPFDCSEFTEASVMKCYRKLYHDGRI